jgi:lambda family phage tail tape measure protein
MAGTSALIGKLGLLLSGTLVVGLAAAGAAWLAITLKTREYDSTLVALTKATEDSVVSQKRLNDALEAGLSALVKSNDLQAERIRLLREGKSAADAAAGAMDNLGYASAKSAETQAAAALRVAKEKLNSEEFKGQDINFNPSPAFVEAFDNVQKLTKAAKDSQIELERAASNSVKAGMEGRRKEAQDIAEKAFAEVEVQNKKFKAIAERGKLAKLELEEGKFYGSKEVQDARKATLKKDIERAEAAARFSPIDSKTAESDSTKVELARREAFLSENSLAYERKPKATAAAAVAKPNKDLRKTLDENLSSAIKQEQIQLAEELVDIEIELAGQTINSVIATEKKNAAIKASLEIERLLIEASLEDAIVAKDALQITKFKNDLDENSAKLKKQEKATILDVTKARIADKVAIEDMGVVTDRYIDDLRFEREALELTDNQVASLRVERERLREQENLSIKVARNQITPDQAAAEAEAINARAEAKRADEEFQQSYVAGWKKAYKAYADAATSETKRAADTFTTLTNAMESALDQFLTTGKLNFAEFAKSVIFELAKIEAKALIAKAAGAVGGGGGLAGIVGNILGMLGGGSFGTSGTTNSFMTNGVALRSAKGNVFDMKGNLVNTFATGGIVDRPTLFAFAKGGMPSKGLMGEAGPEAILPVARDSAGRLGVRSTGVGGDNISVTINLPPGAPAQDIRRATGDLARELTAAVGRSRRYA